MQFNPNMMSLNDLASLSPMKNQAMGMYGSALPQGMNQDMMSQMGQQMLNAPDAMQNGQQMTQPQDMTKMDMMNLGRQAIGNMQGMMGRGQQQAPTQQIIRDSNRFSYTQNPQQQMAMALRQRG